LLADWVKDLHALAPPEGAAPPQRILFFSVMPFWVEYCVPIAVALAARGNAVDLVHLPYTLFDRPEPGLVPPSRLQRLWPFATLHPRLNICNLLHVRRAPVTKEMEAAAKECSKPDPAYIHRRESLDITSDPAGRDLFHFRVGQNLDCMARLQHLLTRRGYDSMLVPQGDIYEFAAAYRLAALAGLPCVTFAMWERRGEIMVSHTTPAALPDTDPAWRADEPHVLTPERDEAVAHYLLSRQKPNWDEHGFGWKGQLAAVEPENALRHKLGLSRDKPVALLCPSIAWDAAILGAGRAFRTMSEWVAATVEWFCRQSAWQLVVRCHPGEVGMPSNEPVERLLAERFPHLPAHVRVLDPLAPVNTYALLPFTDLGLVYVTTTGLEMAACGIPVIMAGATHYSGKGFTTDPPNREEYFAALERATRTPARLPRRQQELARCYIYVYTHTVAKPFPWQVCTLPEDLAKWPVRRIVAGDCPAGFLRTVEELAGRRS
jgi:hypothetical protein